MKKPRYRASSTTPDHIMISINGDAKHSMSVTWRTSTDVEDGFVSVRRDNEKATVKYRAHCEKFTSDIDESLIWWCRLDNLEPDTKYFYRVCTENFSSEEYFFTTEPENLTKFKFVCVSDQQKGEPHDCPDYSGFNRLMKNILKIHPDIRFIYTAGDNTDCGMHEQQWNGMFEGIKGIAEYIPYMMTEGNHDTRGFADYEKGTGRYYSEPAAFFCEQLKDSYNYDGPESCKTENYSFDYGNAHFNSIGVNFPEDVNRWLIDDLSKCDKTWKIGAYHFPICYSGCDCQNYDVYPVMREGIEMEDIVFSGHEHNFARSFPLKNESLYSHPSEGTVFYTLGNSNQNPPGTHSMPKVWHTAYYPHEERKSMVCIVEIDGEKMTLTSLLSDENNCFDNCEIVDKCVIDKSSDTIEPPALPPVYGENRTRYFFKGEDVGLASMNKYPEKKGGEWFLPFAILVAFIGGFVDKQKGKVTMSVYDHTCTFFEDSDICVVDGREEKQIGKVYRRNDQLYVPADSCKFFGMRYAYAQRNNFLSFEHESEDRPFTVQP